MYKDQFTYELLIKGKSLTEYLHEGNTYVEGRHGSEFELYFKNNSNKRVLFIPSVDGLSTFDGQPAGSESRGYVVNAWSSITVPGWTLDSSSVAKFTFSSQENSYSVQSGQGTNNVGVVGALVFEEEAYIRDYSIPFTSCYPSIYPNNIHIESKLNAVPLGGAVGGLTSNSIAPLNNVSPDSKLGTGFGEQSQFKTTSTNFIKGSLLATLVIYYDSRRNLERKGIRVIKGDSVKKTVSTPNPFPVQPGCIPPKGWEGVNLLDDLLNVLTDPQKVVMKTLLQGVETSQLKGKYAEYLPAILKI